MGIIQIAMIGIGAVALALMVKQQKSEYALYLSLSAVVLILVFSMNRLQVVMETIRKIEQYTGIDVATFSRSSICPSTGLTSTGGSRSPVGLMICSAMSIWCSSSYLPGVADTNMT